MPEPQHFGHIEGVEVGTVFNSYKELNQKKIHRETQAGITGRAKAGAESIVVKGAYRDDEDYGDYVIYTGAGGRDDRTKRQIADQDINNRFNAALVKSHLEGLPVRVIRGVGTDAPYAPEAGYRYDGIFRVTDHWGKTGEDGFGIVQFRLDKIEIASGLEIRADSSLPWHEGVPQPVAKRATVIQRQIRSSRVTSQVKSLHNYKCQVCHESLKVPGGEYAEGAHIRGLGHPHRGHDVPSNVLCLCPNDHVRFDYGAIYLSRIANKWHVVDAQTQEVVIELRTVRGHTIDPDHVAYHRDLWQRMT
jgi:putative restriction endonuclease